MTLDATPDAARGERLALPLARADAGDRDVVVKGIVAGEARGALHAGAGTFRTDRANEPTLYRYRNTGAAAPISRVRVRTDRLVVAGGGAGFGYTLDEPRQGRLALRLALGAALCCARTRPRAREGDPRRPRGTTRSIG